MTNKSVNRTGKRGKIRGRIAIRSRVKCLDSVQLRLVKHAKNQHKTMTVHGEKQDYDHAQQQNKTPTNKTTITRNCP